MKLSDYEALSFDCYGTLIDWEAGIAAFLGPWARGQGCELGDEELLVIYSGHEARAERENPAMLYPDILAFALDGVGDQLRLQVSATDRSSFAQSVPAWPAFDDSVEALQSLKQTHQLIILSNVDRASFAASNARLGVEFDAIITAEDVGSYKPNPANFDVLTRKVADLGIPEGRLLHVAQSLFHDHVPARQASLPTVWINRRAGQSGWGATPDPGNAPRPDFEFGSMAQFAHAVREDR